jgi:ubiquinone/menaquinone biosynthesis C-methylase UbiE
MDPDEYAVMARVESDHWWYSGLRDFVAAELGSLVNDNVTILDAGCGTGGTIEMFEQLFPIARLIGIDINPLAISHAKRKAGGIIAYGSINALPIADTSVDAITALDVIYHDDVDEKLAFSELNRVLKPDGIVVINLPAFEWLRSRHDEAIHTARRYTTGELREKASKAGFDITMCQYRNSLLFPFMMMQRFLRKSRVSAKSGSAVNLPPIPVNYLFGLVMTLENTLMRLGVRFPAGGSVFALLRKRVR